jgi:hypothetical protein
MVDPNPRGSYKDISTDQFKGAWLYYFGVDKSEPKPAHKEWLKDRLAPSIGSEYGQLNTRDFWQVWVIGTTSRTADFHHNFHLSRRRAEAVRDYLGGVMKNFQVGWNIITVPLSEAPATLAGRRNDVEHAFDRAVLVVAQKNKSRIHLDVPRSRAIDALFCVSLSGFSVKFVGKWRGFLYAKYPERLDSDWVCDAWPMSATAMDFISGTPGIPGTNVKVPGNFGMADFFAGFDTWRFASREDLDRLNDASLKFSVMKGPRVHVVGPHVWWDKPKSTMSLIIKPQRGSDVRLSLDTGMDGWKDVMAAIGGYLGKRQRLEGIPRFPVLKDGRWVEPPV